MTLKQEQVINRLPLNGYNMAESMRQAGYSQQSTRAGSLYASLRRKVEKAFNPEQIKADIRKAEKDFAKSGDNSNRARMIELRAKCAGLGRETAAITNIIGDVDIKALAGRANVTEYTKGSSDMLPIHNDVSANTAMTNDTIT